MPVVLYHDTKYMHSRLKSDLKLQKKMSSFTPFRTVQALDEFMDWMNTDGVAEQLCQYKYKNHQLKRETRPRESLVAGTMP